MLPSFLQTCADGAYQNIPHWHQGSDCCCSYQTFGTKWFLTPLLPHVWQVTSTSKQSEGVLCYKKLWYLFYRYLRVSPGTTWKCMLHDSVRYWNTCSRDPITLLSMDIVVETFSKIGVSDLLVSTWHLQDPLYMEVWETYLSLSIGLGKQIFMIFHNILLNMSVVEWLTLRITHLCLPVSIFKLIKQVYCHHYDLNLSPTSHELGDVPLLQHRFTLFLQKYNTTAMVTTSKRALMAAARLMATVTKRAMARVARAMAMATKGISNLTCVALDHQWANLPTPIGAQCNYTTRNHGSGISF